MLIVALFLVLVSNHMDERLAEGKSVIRLNACFVERRRQESISSEREKEVGGVYNEHTSLIKNGHTGSKVSLVCIIAQELQLKL